MLGLDTADKRQVALDLMKKLGLTFPCILDPSMKGIDVMRAYRLNAAPTTYLIDREGKITDAWTGFSPDDERAAAALKKLKLE